MSMFYKKFLQLLFFFFFVDFLAKDHHLTMFFLVLRCSIVINLLVNNRFIFIHGNNALSFKKIKPFPLLLIKDFQHKNCVEKEDSLKKKDKRFAEEEKF